MSPDRRRERVAELVAECLGRLDDGAETVDIAEVCAGDPELEAAVRRAVELAQELPALSMAPLRSDRRRGATLGARYQLGESIGAGAMGIVYAATDLELGREVAVKVVHAHAVEYENALARFEREISALAAVRHDSVVTIHDRGATEEGEPFLVMERIDGVSCAELLEHAAQHEVGDDTAWLSEHFGIDGIRETSFFRQSLRWGVCIAEAISAAHRAGVVHRDIKPSNILVRRDGRPVVLDFGVAALERDATLTRTGSTLGTPAYMAPEALRGRTRDQRSLDVYGLAATLYHLVTLRAPYVGSPTQVLTALATREPEPATKVRPGVPKLAEAVLEKGLARRPSARYESADALRADIDALLSLRPVTAKPRSDTSRIVGRIVRSRLFLGAALAVAAFGLWQGAEAWRARVDARAAAAWVAPWQALPANLCVVGAKNRDLPIARARAEVLGHLDELVDSGHDRVVALALRASFQLDQGAARAAADDMQRVAREAGSAFTSALAERYADLAESATGELPALEDLPAPDGAWDRYLLGLHLIRANRHGDSVEWLADERLDGVRHVEELRLLLRTPELGRLERRGETEALERVAEELVRAVHRLEDASSYRSPTSQQVIAVARLRSGRIGDVVEACEAGLALSPWSQVLLQNLGEASLRLGRLDAAREAFRAAEAIADGYLPILSRWAIVEAQDGDPEAARALLERCEFSTTPRGRSERAIAVAKVEIDIALWHLRALAASGDEGSAHGRLAVEAAERALHELAQLSDTSEAREKLEPIARALRDLDSAGIARGVLVDLVEHPLSWPRLVTALDLLPEDLEPEIDGLVRRWMEAVGAELARQASVHAR